MTDFASLFDTFKSHAFRYEALPEYDTEEEREALLAFKSGLPIPTDWAEEWLDFIRQVTADGKSMSRVRLIPDPVTAYYEFESTMYGGSIKAGEQILVVEKAMCPPMAVGIPDFWLFDDKYVGVMRYDEHGAFLDADVIEDPVEVQRYVDCTQALMTAARPLSEF